MERHMVGSGTVPAGALGNTRTPTPAGDRRWGWWAIVFVVAFVASIVAGNALQVGKSLYLPDASVAQLRAFYGASGGAVLAQSALQMLAAVALYRFGYRLRGALRAVEDRAVGDRAVGDRAVEDRAVGDRATAVAGWGAAVAAGAMLLSVLCGLALLLVAGSAGDGVVAGLGRAALVLGGAVHLLGSGLLIVAASAVGLRLRLRPRWVFGYGWVVGPLVAASALSVVIRPLVKPEPAFRLLAAVWLVGLGVGVLRGRFAGAGAATGSGSDQPSARTGSRP